MTYLDWFVISLYSHRIAGQVLKFVASITTLCAASSIAQSEPVIFAFDAEVTEIIRPANSNFELPFEVNLGDHLQGILQFEPIVFGHSGEAEQLVFQLRQESFSIQRVPLLTRDNQLIPAGFIEDSISVGCSTTISCATATSTAEGTALDQLRLSLTSQDPMTVDSGDNLGDVGIWNRFVFGPDDATVGFDATRLFVLELRPTATDAVGTVLIKGNLGPLMVIPEPAASILLVGLFSLCTFHDRRFRIGS